MRLGPVLLPMGSDRALANALTDFFRQLVTKVNGLASGSFADSADNAATTIPSAGTWARGDSVRNSAPAILGAPGSRYVVAGWLRITDGSANVVGTDWVEDRRSTGT